MSVLMEAAECERVGVQVVRVGAECMDPLSPDKYFICILPAAIKGASRCFQREVCVFCWVKVSTFRHILVAVLQHEPLSDRAPNAPALL